MSLTRASLALTCPACALWCSEKCIVGANYAVNTGTDFSLIACAYFNVMDASTSVLDAYVRAISRRFHLLMLGVTSGRLPFIVR